MNSEHRTWDAPRSSLGVIQSQSSIPAGIKRRSGSSSSANNLPCFGGRDWNVAVSELSQHWTKSGLYIWWTKMRVDRYKTWASCIFLRGSFVRNKIWIEMAARFVFRHVLRKLAFRWNSDQSLCSIFFWFEFSSTTWCTKLHKGKNAFLSETVCLRYVRRQMCRFHEFPDFLCCSWMISNIFFLWGRSSGSHHFFSSISHTFSRE